MAYSKEVRDQFNRMRRSGRSLGEIAKHLEISKSTASLWAREVRMTMQGRQRLNRKIGTDRKRAGNATASLRRRLANKEAEEGMRAGRASEVDRLSAMCIGLYWGDGARSDGRWRFSNTDHEAVTLVLRWARRSGYAGKFVAYINAYDDSPYTEEEIEDFWKSAGIDDVVVKFLESKCADSKSGKHPFGCCHVTPRSNKRFLFNYYLAQREMLTDTPS